MPIAVSIAGGNHHTTGLSAAERQAAHQALSKLSAGTPKVSGLVGATGTDTFVGGAAVRPVAVVSHTTATAGSFGSVGSTATHGAAGSVDTINVAGQTAASVKAPDAASKSTSTLTLSDKTTVTLTGIPAHNLIKPH